jgi:glycosyl transferase family 87
MPADEVPSVRAAEPLRRALAHALGFWAVAALLWVLIAAALRHKFALDFHYAYLPAAHAVLHGSSPYPTAYAPAVIGHDPFVYPPLTAYLLGPLSLLPPATAEVIMAVFVAAAVPATLLVLGIRDWRCYAAAFLWWPTIISIQSANVTLPMLFGFALVWRYRNQLVVPAVATGLLIALKLFFFPLLVWLVATRRYRTALLGAAASLLFVFAPWAGLGFAGLRAYPHLLTSLSHVVGPRTYSIAALLHRALPIGWTVATGLQMAIGIGVVLLVIAAGRRGRERDAIALTVIAILLLTPLLELQYFAMLLVLLCLYRNRLDVAWFVPLLMWGAPADGPGGSTLRLVYVLVVAGATVLLAVQRWRPRAFRWPRLRPA